MPRLVFKNLKPARGADSHVANNLDHSEQNPKKKNEKNYPFHSCDLLRIFCDL